MRRIGNLEDASLAERFCDYLVTRSIDATYEKDSDGCDIWIRDEASVSEARAELERFRVAPESAAYDVKDEAARIRKRRQEDNARRLKAQRDFGKKAARSMSGGSGLLGGAARQQNIPVTIGVILVSVIATFATNRGVIRPPRDGKTWSLETRIYFAMAFVDPRDYARSEDSFASVRKGELWRLVTPVFLHGSMLHLVFNMIWIYTLGSAIERLHGSPFFCVLMLLTQIVGMMVQVLLPDWMPEPLRGSPFAIGASGAVFGLFGFLWLRPYFDRTYPIRIPSSNVAIMLGWLVLCIVIIPGIANGAHIGGLLSGVAAGAFWPRMVGG